MRFARPCKAQDCPHVILPGAECPIVAHRRQIVVRKSSAPKEKTTKRFGSAWAAKSALVLSRDGWICHICGQPGADTTDHLIPRKAGGRSDLDNLAAAHRACNSRKGAK